LSEVWVNRCLLGAGYAAVMVAVAVQKMWLPWSIYFGRWKSRFETSGRMEKKRFYQETLTKITLIETLASQETLTIEVYLSLGIKFNHKTQTTRKQIFLN